MNLDSQYGACFRVCLGRLLSLLEARGNRDIMNVVTERGDPHAGNCERIFNEIRSRWRHLGRNVLGTFALANKSDCMPLMVADLLASAHSKIRSAANRDDVDLARFTLSPKTDKAFSSKELLRCLNLRLTR
jgi:hypothetical protein